MAGKKRLPEDLSFMSLRVPREHYQKGTAIAALRGETLSDVMRNALREYVEEHHNLILNS
jgi:predicted DNA-binding protein